MGVLQRFERRLEGLVEGAFAKVFGGVVQPVEVAAALQREAAQNKQIVGPNRVVVPNSYVVEIGSTDAERFGEWQEQLQLELAAMVREHAAEQGWSFVDDVRVGFEQVGELGTGVFRVRSHMLAAVQARPHTADQYTADPRRTDGQSARQPYGRDTDSLDRPRLVLAATPDSPERVLPLTRASTVLGRGNEADVRLPDTGVSRRHAELQLEGHSVRIADLGSTNGTRVNGRRVDEALLEDGDAVDIGATRLTFRSSG